MKKQAVVVFGQKVQLLAVLLYLTTITMLL
jgi:hypothetical protein